MAEPETKSENKFEAAALYTSTTSGVTAPETVKGLKGDDIFILAYTPDFCGFVTFQDGNFTSMDGKEIAHEAVFELRCFCEAFDLRWVRDANDGKGNGVIVSEKQFEGCEDVPGEFFIRSGRYLLWGKGTERGGRVRLFEHRVGELPIPAEIEEKLNKGSRFWLSFDEYFSPDEYGNMVWRLERLKGLEVE